ncbi:MAG TPA: Rnase Y domain-containing protein, partial [Candidatus Kryptobacter bacterium]
MITTAVAVVCSAAAFLVGWFVQSGLTKKKLGTVQERTKQTLEAADREANAIKKEKLIEVKDEWIKKRQELDNDYNAKQKRIQNIERQLGSKEENLDRKADALRQQEKSMRALEMELREKTKTIQSKESEAERLVQMQTEKLEKLAGVSREDAKKFLIENLTNEARSEASLEIREIREKARIEAKKEAQKIIVQAIQRTAADHSVETTVSVVSLPNEEMKGRIIGREGRNIRSFEAVTGCDIIVDDTPDAVVISGFDPFRREIAKTALERLISDGRIHPTKIEEIV